MEIIVIVAGFPASFAISLGLALEAAFAGCSICVLSDFSDFLGG